MEFERPAVSAFLPSHASRNVFSQNPRRRFVPFSPHKRLWKSHRSLSLSMSTISYGATTPLTRTSCTSQIPAEHSPSQMRAVKGGQSYHPLQKTDHPHHPTQIRQQKATSTPVGIPHPSSHHPTPQKGIKRHHPNPNS